jgi:hypothetical protein
MPKFDLFIARFPFKRIEDPDVTEYYANLRARLRNGDRISDMIGQIYTDYYDDTPITMLRNLAVEDAKAKKADLLMMIDSDISADYLLGLDNMAQPFFDTSFEHIINTRKPAIVASPYCGPPPHENVYCFKVANYESNNPNKVANWTLAQFTREEVAQRSGIEHVMALATGLILIDMRVFEKLEPPYFDYGYSDKFKSRKDTTEDVYFTRNATVAGYECYCNWYSWSKHWKNKGVGKPMVMTPDQVHGIYKEAFTEERMPSDVSLLQFKSKAG